MKRFTKVIVVAFIIIGIGIFIHWKYFSLSAMLSQYNFSKEDILVKDERTPINDINQYMLLLANDDTIGLISAEKKKFGKWEAFSVSILDTNTNGELPYVENWLAEPRLKYGIPSWIKNLYIALLTDEELDNLEQLEIRDVEFEVNTFNVNDKILTLIHGISVHNWGGLTREAISEKLELVLVDPFVE